MEKIISWKQHLKNLKQLQNKDKKEKGTFIVPITYYEKFLPYRILEFIGNEAIKIETTKR